MNNALIMDVLQSETDLQEQSPDPWLAELQQSTCSDTFAFFVIAWWLQNVSTHGLHPLQVLRKITPVAVFHDEEQLVSLGNERINVAADVSMAQPLHICLLLLGLY